MLQGIWVTGERWLEPCGEWKGEMVVWREPGQLATQVKNRVQAILGGS